jgi:MFS family permease
MDPNTTSLLATGVYGITNTLFTLPAVFFLDRVGRRILLMVGSLVAAFGHDWPGHVAPGRVAIAFVYVYDVFFSFSWAPIGWVLPSEIFNLATRSTAVSITTSTTWMSNFIIGVVSPMMLEKIPHGGTYFFFAGFAVLGFLSTYFFLPETRRVTLEEMDGIWGAKTSEEDRRIADTVFREIEAGEEARRGVAV